MSKGQNRALSKAGREQRKLIERAGFAVSGWDITGGNHIRFSVKMPNGNVAPVIAALTPGDARGYRNMIARLRRTANANART